LPGSPTGDVLEVWAGAERLLAAAAAVSRTARASSSPGESDHGTQQCRWRWAAEFAPHLSQAGGLPEPAGDRERGEPP